MSKHHANKKPKGNYFRELDKVILKTTGAGKEKRNITLNQLFNLLSRKSINDNDICQKDNNINKYIIEDARTLLIAKFPGLYADYIEGWPKSTHSFLLDQNLQRDLSINLWHDFGRATHTEIEGMDKAVDSIVWKWAVENNIKAIITNDLAMGNIKKDLGAIAVKHAHDTSDKDAKNLPFIIQVESQITDDVNTILKNNKGKINYHIENRTTPYIYLTAKKCVTGPSYEDIAKYKWPVIQGMINDLSYSLKLERQSRSAASPSSDQAPIARRHHGC